MNPNRWIDVPNEENSSKAHSRIINRYLWRDIDGSSELIVVFDDNNGKVRYKYFGVDEDTFEELYFRTFHPEDYNTPIDKWFLRNISEDHEHQTFQDFKNEEG